MTLKPDLPLIPEWTPGWTSYPGYTMWFEDDDEWAEALFEEDSADDLARELGYLDSEPYSPEDALMDALQDLPTPDQVATLVGLLRYKELKEVAAGVINDCSKAALENQPMGCATAIVSWVATGEEIVTNRRSLKYILSSRNRAVK